MTATPFATHRWTTSRRMFAPRTPVSDYRRCAMPSRGMAPTNGTAPGALRRTWPATRSTRSRSMRTARPPAMRTHDRHGAASRGRVPPRLPRDHALGDRARRGRSVVVAAAAGRARRACGVELSASSGRTGQQLPAHDDPCRGAGACARASAVAMARQGRRAALRPAQRADRRQARRHPGHGHDREAGRQRRAGQHHGGHAVGDRGRVRTGWPQVVLLGADVRWLPGAGAGARWPGMLPVAALAAHAAAKRSR